MIKCGDKLEGKPQCILYSKDGSKVLGRFPYSKHGGEKGAKAAAHKREGAVQFFKQKHQELADAIATWGAPNVLKYLLEKDCEACQEVVKAHLEKAPEVEKVEEPDVEKAYKPPPGWNDPKSWLSSKEGADTIRKKAWSAMGGKESTCAQHMAGKVDDPDAFCASMKDKVTGTTKWRGKEEKKSFDEIAEEALMYLQKDEDDDDLSALLDGVDLSELEEWLDAQGEPEPEPESEPEPEPEPTPEPEPAPEPVPAKPPTFVDFLRNVQEEKTARMRDMVMASVEVDDGQDD